MGFYLGMVPFLCSDILVSGLTVNGNFGSQRAETTFALNEQVSWKDAADLCYLRTQGGGGLLYMESPDVLKNYLMYLRHSLQQNGWPLSSHIWISIVGNGMNPWKRSGYSESCRDISTQYNDFLPDPPKGYKKCLLLNMTGSSEDDVYMLRSCDEQFGYFCRPSSTFDPALVELTMYVESIIHTDILSNITTVFTSIEGSLDNCKRKLATDILAFAVMYFTTNQTCLVLSNKPYLLPVSIELLADKHTTTVVQSKGPSVIIVDSQNIQVKTSRYQRCFGTLDYSSQGASYISTPSVEAVRSTNEKTFEFSTVTTVTYGTSENQIVYGCQGYCQLQCLTGNQSEWKSGQSTSLNDARLDKKLLSSYRRRHSSATDGRLSAFLIGLSGVFVLVLTTLVIIVPDVTNLVKQCKSQHRRKQCR